MRRRLATLAAVSIFALALGASPALAGSPLTRTSYDITYLNTPTPDNPSGGLCGYMFVSGQIIEVARDPSTAAHDTLSHVIAERDGVLYKVVGGEIYNDLNGHQTWKMMFVAMGGGIADSINIVFRAGRNYDPADPMGSALVAHENDSCRIYG